MSGLVEYISSWWVYPQENEDKKLQENNTDKKYQDDSRATKRESIRVLISPKDLLSVKLTPIKNVIPAPARNMPCMDKFSLSILNKAQLKEILSIKLRKTKIRSPRKKFIHRHPVLKELLEKTKRA